MVGMTAPGGSSDEGGEGVPAPPSLRKQPPEQPVPDAPWADPTTSFATGQPPTLDYPPTQTGPIPGYPPPLPPSGYPLPGYPTYGAPPPSYPPPSPYGGAYPPPNPYGGAYPPPYPGYGNGYGTGYGAPQSGTNSMATVSLVAAILGVFCCIGSIVGIACGTIALNQIKQTREEGHGLAVAGLVISVATVLVYAVAVLFNLALR